MILLYYHVLLHRCHLESNRKVSFTFKIYDFGFVAPERGNFGILYKGRLISILSKRKTFGFHTSFRYVVHLPTGESLTAFAICRQLAQLSPMYTTFSQLTVAVATSSSSWHQSQASSLLAGVNESVSESVSDKHCQ